MIYTHIYGSRSCKNKKKKMTELIAGKFEMENSEARNLCKANCGGTFVSQMIDSCKVGFKCHTSSLLGGQHSLYSWHETFIVPHKRHMIQLIFRLIL